MVYSSSSNRPSPISVVASANKHPAKPLLIIDRKIAKEWNLAPEDIHIYKNTTLASLRLEAGCLTHLCETPEDLARYKQRQGLQ